MTPEEKAKELYHKFYDRLSYETMSLNQKRVLHQDAKDCAIITVTEIIDVCQSDESAWWNDVRAYISLL